MGAAVSTTDVDSAHNTAADTNRDARSS